jgi:hypothetical protein
VQLHSSTRRQRAPQPSHLRQRRRRAPTDTSAVNEMADRFWAAVHEQFEELNEAYWERAESDYGKLLFDALRDSLPAELDSPFHYCRRERKIPKSVLSKFGDEVARRDVSFWNAIENSAPETVLDPAVDLVFERREFCGASSEAIDAVHKLVIFRDWHYDGASRTLDAARKALKPKEFVAYYAMLADWASRADKTKREPAERCAAGAAQTKRAQRLSHAA